MISLTFLFLLLYSVQFSGCTKPVLYLSANMRSVLLPADTQAGTVIYRLRASDADDQYPISFGVVDKDERGRTSQGSSRVVAIENVDCSKSICSADVVLISSLSEGQIYKLALVLQDTSRETTIVDAEIVATKHKTAFKSGPRIITVPEDTKPESLLGYFLISNNEDIYRGVSCYIKQISPYTHGNNTTFIVRKELTPVEGDTKCSIYLEKPLDYEVHSSYVMQIIAENAWVDGTTDSRNVAVAEFIINVENIADTPPLFLSAPPVTRLPESSKVGDFVCKIVAVDGDKGLARPIRYILDTRYSSHAAYFKLDSITGRLTVKRNLQELEEEVGPGVPLVLRIIAQEVEEASSVHSRQNRLVDQISSVEIAVIIDDVINRPPRFLQSTYITTIEENCEEGTRLKFDGGLDKVEDLDKGQNGILELSIRGHEDIFEVSPPVIQQFGQFVISVKNNKKIDAEKIKKFEFQIIATETGPSRQSTSADVIVNVLNINDNPPVFSQSEYRISIREDVRPGSVILKVEARDPDGGQVVYTGITGDLVMAGSLQIDRESGEVTITDNRHLDRETRDSYLMMVEARDEAGSPDRSNIARARLIISIEDVNDVPPLFKQRKYEGFMTSDLSRLRNNLQVEAVDLDKSGTQNSDVRYEIIAGNYEKKFSIDEESGVISVVEPLQVFGKGRSERDLSLDEIDPIITLQVRAYDLGIPSLDSQVPVNIFTQDVQSRVVKFIVEGSVSEVFDQQDEISDLLSTITGGVAEIQDIQSFSGQDGSTLGTLNIDRMDRMDRGRSGRDQLDQSKSVVDVFIRYPATSVVDVDAIKQKLVSDPRGSDLSGDRGGRADTEKKKIEEDYTLIKILAAILSFLLLFVLIFILCCCCPKCPCYKDTTRNKVGPATEEDIQVLTVRDGDGKALQDARFVEILKSAKSRIKSATDSLRGTRSRREAWSGDPRRRRWKVRDSSVDDLDLSESPSVMGGGSPEDAIKIKVLDESRQESGTGRNSTRARHRQNIYILKEATLSGEGPYIISNREDLSSSDSVLGSVIRRSLESVPRDSSKIFKVIDKAQRRSGKASSDVQILKIDEDQGGNRTEYMKVGNAEVLNLEDRGVSGQEQNYRYNRSTQWQPQSIDGEDSGMRRSYSEQDLYHHPQHLQDPQDPQEFYTAVGPDGKEIILRKYLQDQAETQDQLRIGFVNQALGHLQQELGGSSSNPVVLDPVHYYHQQRDLLQAGERSEQVDPVQYYQQQRDPRYVDERSEHVEPGYTEPDYHQRFHRLSGYPGTNYDQSGYDSEEDYKHRHYGGLVTGYGDQKYSNASHASRSPKHKIRTPIIEETESTVERELISRDQSRRLRPLGSSENLNLSLSDGKYEGQEVGPQYAETKSSILRRRNSKAKMSNKSGSERGVRRRRRVNSLSDLSSVRGRNSNLKRRNSISYDDIQRYDRLRQYDDLNQSRSTTLSKKFSVYTGLSPKEKIEYDNYTDIRENYRQSLESGQAPRRFSVRQTNRTRGVSQSDSQDLPSLEFTYDINGEVVSASPRKREQSKSDQLTTPRYMDWYIKQQQQQTELLRARQQELQHQQLITKERMVRQHRELEQQFSDNNDDLDPGDSVSNHGTEDRRAQTDDDKLRRLSTAEKLENNDQNSSSMEIPVSVDPSSEEDPREPDILNLENNKQ